MAEIQIARSIGPVVVVGEADFDDLVAKAEEAERLRAELHRIRNDSLVWAMACPHDCPACDAMYESIKGAQHPSSTEPAASQDTK